MTEETVLGPAPKPVTKGKTAALEEVAEVIALARAELLNVNITQGPHVAAFMAGSLSQVIGQCFNILEEAGFEYDHRTGEVTWRS